ncbi:MAG TPA: acetylxylan esterase [Bryobacteraceae bacterium]
MKRQSRCRFLSRAAILTMLALPLVLGAQPSLDVAPGLSGMLDNYLSTVAKQEWQKRDALIAAIKTPAQVKARQEYIRGKLLEEIGGFPERTPLHPKITGTLDHPDYKVEKLIYESIPHFYVTASVYVPKNAQPPYPAVVGVAGHSGDGKAYDHYQPVWVSLAKRGIVVLAIDPPGQGERFEYLDASGKPMAGSGGTGEHMMAGVQCLLTGTNIARYFIWDGIRGVDYLTTRPDVDAKKIGVAGNSGGGTQSTYLAAFEPRLAVAAPSCYITSWEKLWSGPGPQDSEQVFANFLKDGLDFSDFLIAFAPKPIQMATATRDFFPIDGAKATFAQAQRIFGVLGAADHAGFFEFDDTHGWSQPRREATYRWFARWLQGKDDDGREGPLKLDTPKDLRSTETGQVQTTYTNAETVQSLNAAVAAKLESRRPASKPRNLLAALRKDLALSGETAHPVAIRVGEISRASLRIEKIALQPESGITVPALVFVPSGAQPRKRAILYLNPAGKAVDAEEGGAVEQLARQGAIVMAIDPRGWGESAPPSIKKSGYTQSYQTAMRGILVGKPLPGMQTFDVLNSFAYLVSRPDVDGHHVSVYTKGNAAALGIYAGVLEPRIQRIVTDRAPQSFADLTQMKMHGDIAGMIVPGILRDLDLPDLIHLLGPRFHIEQTAKQ